MERPKREPKKIKFEGIIPVPDPGFMRKLKAISPKLGCEFSREHARFVITCEGEISGRYELFLVEGDEGGGYRYPDNRDIRTIHEADRYFKSRRQREREAIEYMRKHREDEEKRERDTIRNMTKDGKHQLRRTYIKAANLGKCESTFRKINARPRGKVIKRDGYTVIDRTAVNT